MVETKTVSRVPISVAAQLWGPGRLLSAERTDLPSCFETRRKEEEEAALVGWRADPNFRDQPRLAGEHTQHTKKQHN
jgi:hypothetical protein